MLMPETWDMFMPRMGLDQVMAFGTENGEHGLNLWLHSAKMFGGYYPALSSAFTLDC